MSDGGGESSKECAQQNVWRKSGPDEFSHALAKFAVAQICECGGFQSFQPSSLDTLADVTIQYIINIGKVAHFHANLSGRTGCDVFDIVQGLEDLASPQGFLGASDVDHYFASSGTLREIVQYVGEVGKIPFVYPTPRFPVLKDQKPTPSFLALGEEPLGEHIPSWLPSFPDVQTYTQLPMPSKRATDSPMENTELARHHRKAERSLLSLQQQWVACNGSEGLTLGSVDVAKAKRAAENNPFLVAPFPFWEKEVSPVVLPAKFLNETAEEGPTAENHGADCPVLLLETYDPAIDAMKRSSYYSDGKKKALLNQRAAVQFKFGIGKKTLNAAFAGSLQNRVVGDISHWFTKDIEKDEKKREEILLEGIYGEPGRIGSVVK